MSLEQTLKSFYTRTQEFIAAANKILPAGNKMFFNGNIISGNIKNNQVLFLSINPGYLQEDWEKDQLQNKILNGAFLLNECKYIDELKQGEKLARRITDVVLNGNHYNFNDCAETYLTSFLNTPNEAILNQQLAILTPELKAQHNKIMSDYTDFVLNNLLPDNIICIGFNVFERAIRALGIDPKEIKFETYKTASGKDRVFYKSVKHKHTLIHGVLHLSACHISTAGVDQMREIFKKTISFDQS